MARRLELLDRHFRPLREHEYIPVLITHVELYAVLDGFEFLLRTKSRGVEEGVFANGCDD